MLRLLLSVGEVEKSGEKCVQKNFHLSVGARLPDWPPKRGGVQKVMTDPSEQKLPATQEPSSEQPALEAVPEPNAAGNPTQNYVGSVYSQGTLPPEFVAGIRLIEEGIGGPVWLMIQNPGGDAEQAFLNYGTYKAMFEQRFDLPEEKPMGILVHSPGGSPESAYKMAKLMRKRCGEFKALVPSYAKSAATLLSLGASEIVLGTYGELGPLDMQVDDIELERDESALNHVQTLERLSAYALQTMDQTTRVLLRNSRKKVATVVPMAMKFTADIVRPLMENIDVVRYTEMSRILKVGEDYAVRLLTKKYGDYEAKLIANRLVSDYPEHGFVIDNEEAASIGLGVECPEGKVADGFTKILPFMDDLVVAGLLKESTSESN